MPAMPRAGLFVVEAELVLGSFETVLEDTTMPLNASERLNACCGRTPCCEECQIAIADIAPDHEATRPKPRFPLVIFLDNEIGEFAIGPIMKPRAFGAITDGKTLPCTWIEITSYLLSCGGDRRLAQPNAQITCGLRV